MPDFPLLTIHTDGASRGNPGEAAFAYTIERDGFEPIEDADRLGRMTNNQAEYTALVRALEHASELGSDYRVIVKSDSELMVRQVNGEYRVKNAELKPLFEEARSLCRRFRGGVVLEHVRRAENARTDAMCNEALDGKRLSMPRASTFSGAKPTVPAQKAASARMEDEAIACLRRAGQAWAGGVLEPSPERVWGELANILTRHGIALPRQG
jgi:ribonuclease HI